MLRTEIGRWTLFRNRPAGPPLLIEGAGIEPGKLRSVREAALHYLKEEATLRNELDAQRAREGLPPLEPKHPLQVPTLL